MLEERQLLHVARAVAAAHRLTPADRGFNPLPLFHVNAEVVAVLGSLVSGGELVLDDRFHRTGFAALVAERRVTWINAVPAILSILAAEPGTTPCPGPCGSSGRRPRRCPCRCSNASSSAGGYPSSRPTA